MNMRKIVGTASTSLMALTLLVQPALAQAPNLGPDWVVVKERKVKTFVANPAKPGSGSWQLVDVKNRTYFLEDGKVSRKISSSRRESGEIAAGQSDRVYGAEQILTRKKLESLQGDVPNSRSGYYEGSFLVAYKLTRYALFEDVTGFKPWTTYHRYATRTRDINYYMVEWTDPLTSERFGELDATPEVTAWVVGAPYNKDVASTGKENFARRDPQGTEDRRVILSRTYSPQANLAEVASKAPSTKSGTFMSNRGTGNTQVALTGSKLRTAMGANNALASEARKAQSGGSIKLEDSRPTEAQNANSQRPPVATVTPAPLTLLDKVVGKWQLKGGSQSEIKIERAGKSENVKVDVALEIVRGADFDVEFTAPFAKSLSASKSGKTLSLNFNDTGNELYVKLGTITATFVPVKAKDDDK